MRVVGVRVAMDLFRHERHEARPLSMDVARSHALEPELQYLKERYSAEFKVALQESLSVLNDRQRAVVRLYFLEGMSAAAIGPIYRVSARTVQRWVASSQQLMLKETKRLLREKLDLGASQLESLMGLVLTDLDVSFSRLLGEKAGVETFSTSDSSVSTPSDGFL